MDVSTTPVCGVLSSLWRQPSELAEPASITKSDDANHGHTAAVVALRVSVSDWLEVPLVSTRQDNTSVHVHCIKVSSSVGQVS